MTEHEVEPVWGLPEELPAGETILWQGAPSWRELAVRAFHVRKVAIYFAAMIAIRCLTLLADGEEIVGIAISVLQMGTLAALAVGTLVAIAWATGRTTAYTITNRRIVLRIGIALPMMINIPYRLIESAGLHVGAGGIGDIPLTIVPGEKLAYLLLWPHARPWQFTRTQPMLRCIPKAEAVAQVLAGALSAMPAAPAIRVASKSTATGAPGGRTQVAA